MIMGDKSFVDGGFDFGVIRYMAIVAKGNRPSFTAAALPEWGSEGIMNF